MRSAALLLLPCIAAVNQLASRPTRRSVCGGALIGALTGSHGSAASAFIAGQDEEVSGLVVLRIAEVCQFQEKLLRQLAACSTQKKRKSEVGRAGGGAADQFGNLYCEGEAYSANPIQISFGTGIMLRNSNLDGNMRLMIRTEIPKARRDDAARSAAACINTMSKLASTQDIYGTSFTDEQMLEVADLYSLARSQLAAFFDYLPEDSKSRFFNYNAAVRQYEERELEADGIQRMKL
jgi:hypothetical protein